MIRRILPFVLLCAVAAPLSAQVTFGAQTSLTDVVNTAGPTTNNLAHTTAVANNDILLVAVHLNIRPSTGATVTSVTYGGNALTQVAALSDGTPETRTELWYMLNPPAGTANVVATVGGMAPGDDVEVLVSATTFSGVDQVEPSTNTNFGQNTPASVTVTGTTTNDAVLSFVTARETVVLTAGGGEIEGYNTSTGGTNDDLQAAVSGQPGTAGTTAMSWTLSANRRWTIIGVRLSPATADVEIWKYATPDPVAPGGTLTYTMPVLNNGPSTATGVTVVDSLPGGVTFINSSTTQGSCSGTGPVTCNVGTLTNGQTATITINVAAPMSGGAIGNNSATVTTSSTDPAGSNTATANAWSLVQATVCGTQPGKDGAGGTLAGVVNSYWPGTTAIVAAGATGLTLGTRRGAAVSITAGDLLLVIQMQDAAIDSNNDDRYGNGNGVAGGTTGIGAGYTNANQTGRYEYVIATNTVGPAGGALTFTGVNGSGGTIYGYNNAAATATMGQRRYQVVRVPQYTTATLGGTLTASSWNGTTGGILAIDVAGDLALGSSTVSVNGFGFRGGAGLDRDGGGGGTATDYRAVIATLVHGVKGEGIAGTPEWVLDAGVNTDTGPQGYPNGDFARGAPGNAGGGGTDTDPAVNQQNSGGGGGANWGRGGQGGNAWQTNLARGGFGGAPFYDSPGRVVLGGGGGAGSRNNSSSIAGAGGAGGGIVLIRAGRLTGTATITANGAAAYNLTLNDGGGGGGAGGSIVILARGGGIGGLTVQANGGRGGDAWATQAPGVFPGERHGPGGGGGAGYIALNGTPASSSVTGGAAGITTTANDNFGAQAGAPGNVVLTASFAQITGAQSGCLDLTVSISDAPDPVFAGNDITYTQTVTNNSTVVPAQNAVLTQTTPPGTTFVSMTPPAGWTCATLPSVGGTGTITCTANGPLAVSSTTGNFVLVVDTDPALANGSTITQTVTTSASNPETNTTNNSASATTTVARRVDIEVVKTVTDPGPDLTFAEGETITYTITVTNNGPSRATNVVMTDPLPAGFTFSSVNPAGPTCTFSAGTITCTYAAMNPSAVNTIDITGTITTNTTEITNTASATRTETDTDATNDSDSVTIAVVAPTVVHMLEIAAVQDARGKVAVTWTTSFEAENLGFNVYRDLAGTREQINKEVIAGSALFSKRAELTSGRSYRWSDKLKGTALAQYYVEDVDLHGVRTMHGPVTPIILGEVPEGANTDTIADLGSVGGIFISPRGIGAPKRPVIQPTRRQREQQWELAAQAAVKLMVTEEGWYRVTTAELIAAGLAPGRKLALFAEGIEQPINVTDDYIEFYGIGIDTPAAGARAYWLANDKGNDVRIKKEKAKKGADVVTRTPFTFERIERSIFFTGLINNGDRENFFGRIITRSSAKQEVTVENLDRIGSAASLEVVLQGGTDGEHVVQVKVNGQLAGTSRFANMDRKISTISIPLAMLIDGANTIELTAQNGPLDVSVLESVRLTYPHRLVADNDALKVSAAAGSIVNVSGFTSASVRAIDVTDPVDPIELDVEVANGTATVVAPSTGMRSILIAGQSRIKAPAQIVPSRPSSWNATTNAADLLIISARSFTSAAAPLKARRDGEGIATAIVDVQDVYDEFGFGERSPEAIRELLLRSREWARPPKYVLLLGDASFDARNYLGMGAFDYVPTRLVPTDYMKTASDDWLADFANSGVPQLALGRLPARTVAEAETMIRKIVERNASGNDAVNFIADPDQSFDFAGAAQSLAALVPPSSPTSIVNRPSAASFDSLLLTYFGHGSVDIWSAGGFRGTNASQLTNAKLPVVAAMTCLNGYYHDVFMGSLAESLMTHPNGGAVAVWASSTLTEPVPQLDMAKELFRQLFAGATLGEAAMRAKAATTDIDVRRSWILFGDPSMKLK